MNICGIASCCEFQIILVITLSLAVNIFCKNLHRIRCKTKNVTQKSSSTDGHTLFMTLLFLLFYNEKDLGRDIFLNFPDSRWNVFAVVTL